MWCFYSGEGRTDSSPHSANQSMCCLEQIPLKSWLQFSWIRKTWYHAVSVASSSCNLGLLISSLRALINMAPPEICILEITRGLQHWKFNPLPRAPPPPPNKHPLTDFVRNGKQAQRLIVEPKNNQKGMCMDHKPASLWSVKRVRAR